MEQRELDETQIDNTSIRALLVEDDSRLAELTKTYLESHGLSVVWATTGVQGLDEALHTSFDVVLLDLMLPGMDGMEVCRRIRSRCDVPIIMITARVEEADRVLGLESGADDYLSKPFSSRELLARIRAQVRRARGRVAPSGKVVQVGQVRLDPRSMNATLADRPLNLTTYEFRLLMALAERAGRVMTREQLMDLVRGSAEEAFDRSIDVHVSRLRQKLGDDPRDPRLLKTVRGAGYLFAAGENDKDGD